MNNSNAIVIFSSILFSSAATAGSVLELATSEYAQDPPILGTVQVTTEDYSTRLEIASISSDETGGLIYNGERDEIIVLDHDQHEYYVITREQIELMASQVEAAIQEMEETLAELPAEQRDFARKMMEAQMPAKKADTSGGTLSKTGKTDMIAGYACDYYDVLKGELKIRDLCVTAWDDFPEGQEVAGATQELAEFFASMRKAFARSGGLDLMDTQREMLAYMKELNGYPVRYRDYDAAGELFKETLLTGAHNEEVSAAMFEPPPTYHRKELQ